MPEAKSALQMDPVECLKSLKEHVDKCATIYTEGYISLKDKYEKLETSLSKTSEECKTLGTNLTEANKTNENLRNELTTTNQRNEELQKQLIASNKQNEEFQKQLTNFKRRNEALQKELTESGLSLNEALNSNAQLEISLNQAKSEVKDVKVELKHVTDDKSKLELKLKREQNKNAKLIKQLSTMKKLSESLSSLCVSVNDKSDDEDNSGSSSYKDSNPSTPASADYTIRTRASASISPKKTERVSSVSPVSPKSIPAENQSKDKLAFVLVHDDQSKEKTDSQPAITFSSARDSRITRRSPVSPISVASPLSSPVTVEKDNRSTPPTVDVPAKPNQTNTVVSLSRKDNRDTLRGQLSFSALPVTPNNAPKAIPISSDGVVGGNRPSSPSVSSLQNKPNQLRSILSPRSDNRSRSPISSNLVATETSTSKEETSRVPITLPANVQKAPGAEQIVATPSKKDNIPSVVVTSGLDNQSKANPDPTDASNKDTNRPSPTSIIGAQSNQAISSTLPNTDSRNLRRSSMSPVPPSPKNQSIAKPISTDAKEDGRRTSTLIASAQTNQTVIATTPSKYPSPNSPSFPFSPKTPSKGNKEQDVHLSRSSLLVSRAQETRREADDTLKGDKIIGSKSSFNTEKKTSPVAAEKPSNPEPLTIVIEEVCSIEDSTNEVSRPEDTMPLLFPDLRSTPRKSLTDSEGEGSSKNITILDEKSVESSFSSTISDKSTNRGSHHDSNINKFPIVTLSRVEVPKTREHLTPQENRTNRNNPEDIAGPSKRRKSYSGPVSAKRKAIVDSTSDLPSPLRSRVSRQIKQKIICFICKKQNRYEIEFQNHTELDNHILKDHSKVKSIYMKCPYSNRGCRRHFRLLKSLRKHVQLRHLDHVLVMDCNEPRLWSCSSCSLLFNYQRDLNDHVLKKHIKAVKKITKF